MAELTPMMQQYFEIKNEYSDCILFYRLGDFYEMFFDDALTASKLLEITLTGRNCGQEEKAPMCGVPFHSADVYINKLVKLGKKVAICEQVEDPKLAKGLVKRDVIRIITPGTNITDQDLDESKNRYLMAIYKADDSYGIAVSDITTGDFRATYVDSPSKVRDEIHKLVPAEIICNSSFFNNAEVSETVNFTYLREQLNIAITELSSHYFTESQAIDAIYKHFHVKSLEGLGLNDLGAGVIAVGVTLEYLLETQKDQLGHILSVTPYVTDEFMLIDSSTRRNLELTETLREKSKRGSLLWVLDKTKTAMGARHLRTDIEQPILDPEELNKRYDTIECLNSHMMEREELREYLSSIYDLERLMMRISLKTVNPRDMIAFKNSLAMLPHIKTVISELDLGIFSYINDEFDDLKDLYSLIDSAIIDDPPLALKEGGIIKDGFDKELDEIKNIKLNGKEWLSNYEENEKEKTGIKNLRIKYNKIFGYVIEVTNSYKDLVPEEYIRKQTLANCERYVTEELNRIANDIVGAEDKLNSMEYELFSKVRDSIFENVKRVENTAHLIALLDEFASLAYVADHNKYVRPKLNTDGVIDIKDGRHPVVEKMLANDAFICNDTYLDLNDNRVSIITGPNMAGKSTYMRQTALIVLMAQAGSYVPASFANIGICDRIFTRVGASDDLASGQSTFMVEMSEVANILRNASDKSLLILDEIGRGTSTYDGLSIAWSVVEYIANPKLLGAKALFATHYHELTELEGKLNGVNNYCITVKEEGEDIVFLRKIVKGGADKSYGIEVARLAGVPKLVLMRAKEILDGLVDEDEISVKAEKISVSEAIKKVDKATERQMSLFDFAGPNPVVERIKALDVDNLTPMQALKILSELKREV
ncbi:MAG: DNA mismatch repair protein MutS [Lachnospiraceae bacterium]|nr:DNA mismatch repair protein MutS [Lachnospiraceae bacterium]